MRMSEGVEWAMHTCLNLAWVGPDRAVPAARLAAFYDLPPAYLGKQLQSLVQADIASSSPGPRGGFRLAREPETITLMDIVTAIEGPEKAFRCSEIRRRGPQNEVSAGSLDHPCHVSWAMREAELAWRRQLASKTLADVQKTVLRTSPAVPERTRRWFAEQ
ncbi:Rrf2 family transcriptional regulator [Streptomyces eurocidicus]|uniref:Rrf2 family protein n=2 Tax=Streptomyces eurocidicus TaxID=66423 RepID=A0A2N8NXN2_STREU|nr:Rrf2 family transcriptional regulator [Streptomyces eurocidicus]MBB5123183.1 Rrf2 family protein [Streptomyces eurocidicus]MBF6056284.1 Rrf2 family transcriptional regulator [Streptomyces eurocidicus]PNE33533.1 Rrf2 family transcriptional regulator [Streptomyces eurocidicus]